MSSRPAGLAFLGGQASVERPALRQRLRCLRWGPKPPPPTPLSQCATSVASAIDAAMRHCLPPSVSGGMVPVDIDELVSSLHDALRLHKDVGRVDLRGVPQLPTLLKLCVSAPPGPRMAQLVRLMVRHGYGDALNVAMDDDGRTLLHWVATFPLFVGCLGTDRKLNDALRRRRYDQIVERCWFVGLLVGLGASINGVPSTTGHDNKPPRLLVAAPFSSLPWQVMVTLLRFGRDFCLDGISARRDCDPPLLLCDGPCSRPALEAAASVAADGSGDAMVVLLDRCRSGAHAGVVAISACNALEARWDPRAALFAAMLQRDPLNPTVWSSLGRAAAMERVPFGGVSYTRRQCGVVALELNPSNGDEWTVFGTTLRTAEQVGGVSFTQRQCFVLALLLNRWDRFAWSNLGATMLGVEHVNVDGVICTRRQSNVRALELCPSYSAAWTNLGGTMTAVEQVTISGAAYTQRQCLVEALRHEPSYSLAWTTLGNTMTTATERQNVNGTDYTRRQCFVTALRCDHSNSMAWSYLAAIMKDGERVTIRGASYTNRQCFAKSLQLDPADSEAWTNLGLAMTTSEQIIIGGAAYTQRRCHLKALQVDPLQTLAWTNLGNAMTDEEQVTVGGVTLSKADCLRKGSLPEVVRRRQL